MTFLAAAERALHVLSALTTHDLLGDLIHWGLEITSVNYLLSHACDLAGVFILIGFAAFWLWLLRDQPWEKKGPVILGLIAITAIGAMCSSGDIDFAEECDRFGC